MLAPDFAGGLDDQTELGRTREKSNDDDPQPIHQLLPKCRTITPITSCARARIAGLTAYIVGQTGAATHGAIITGPERGGQDSPMMRRNPYPGRRSDQRTLLEIG
jgi:hypothetical protein